VIATVVRRALAAAEAEIGYREKPVNRTKYGVAFGMDGVYWCGIFTWWVWKRAGVDLRTLLGCRPESAESMRAAFARHGALHTTPAVGDIVFFHFPHETYGANHVGPVVTAVHGQYDVETIEGNTNGAGYRDGGGVMAKRRRASIVGYGRVTDLLPPEQRPAPRPAAGKPAAAPTAPHVQEDDDMAQVITADGVAMYVATARHGARHIANQVEAGAQVAAGLITIEQLHNPKRVTAAQLQALLTAAI
jgi:hypothetical protein